MATTRTLKLLLELSAKGSYKAQAGELRDVAKAAGDTQKALAGIGGGAGSKASGEFRALGQTVREAVGEVTKFRSAQDAAADTAIRVAKASGDYGRALALVKTELGLAEAGGKRYNAMLVQSAQLQARVAVEAQRAADAQAKAAQQSAAAQERANAAQAKAAERNAAQAKRDQDLAQEKASTDKLIGSVAGLAAGYATLQTAQAAFDWVKQGAAIEGVEQSFERLAASAGKSSQALLAEFRAASQGMVSDVALMEGANKAVLLGGERLASALPKLLAIAQASARATGQDMQFVFDSLVTGLARNSKQIIDNAGITVDIALANENYAASIGKTVLQLTDQEKALAFQNEVMRQGEQFLIKLGTNAESSAAKIAQVETAWTNTLNKMKAGTAEFLSGASDAVAAMMLPEATIKATAAAIEAGQTYEQYFQTLTKAGLVQDQFNQQQYETAVALAATGTSAEAAASAVKTQSGELASNAQIVANTVIEQQKLAMQAGAVAEASDYYAQKIELVNQLHEQGTITDQARIAMLAGLVEMYNESQAASLGVTEAAYAEIYALAELSNQSMAAAIAQEGLSYSQQLTQQAASMAIGQYFAQGGALDALSLKAWAATDALAALAVAQAQADLAATPVSKAGLIDQEINPESYRAEQRDRAQEIVDPAGAARRKAERQREVDDMNRRNRESMRAAAQAAKPKRGAGGGGGGSRAAGAGSKAKEIDPKKEALQAAKDAAETAKALASLASFAAPSREAIDRYTSTLAAFVESLASRSGVINAKLAETTGRFLDVAKEAVGVLKMGTEAFAALKDYASPPAAAMDAFTSDLAYLVAQFAERSKEVNVELASSVMLFSDTAKAAVETIGTGVEGFKALKGFQGVAQVEIALFSLAMRDTYREFSERTKEIDLTLSEATNTFSESSKQAIETIATGVAAFEMLEKFAPIPLVQIALFSLALRDTYREFSERTKEIDLGLAEATNTFSDSAKRTIETVAVGIEAFDKLSKYQGVPQEKIALISQDIRQTVTLMTQMAAEFDTEGVAAAATFADATGRIIAPIGAAVDAFTKLQEYKGVPQAMMQAVYADMRQAVTLMQQTSAMMDAEGVAAAAVFAGHAATMFSAISGGADALGSIRDYESVAPEAFGAFAGDFMKAVDMTSQLAGASGTMLEQSNVWRSNIDSAVANIKGGIDSLASLNGLSVNISASVSASGSVGAGGGEAPAAGGGMFSLPGRALGGPVNAGQAYTVGERGREVFVPDRAGRIVPNSALKDGTGGVTVVFEPASVVIQTGVLPGTTSLAQVQATVIQTMNQIKQEWERAARAERRGK